MCQSRLKCLRIPVERYVTLQLHITLTLAVRIGLMYLTDRLMLNAARRCVDERFSCDQALYDKKIATFKMSLLCCWTEGGEFESLVDEANDDNDMDDA